MQKEIKGLIDPITKINRVVLSGTEYETEGYNFSTKRTEITTFKDPITEGNIAIFMKNLEGGDEFVRHSFIREDAFRILLMLSLVLEDPIDALIKEGKKHKAHYAYRLANWAKAMFSPRKSEENNK